MYPSRIAIIILLLNAALGSLLLAQEPEAPPTSRTTALRIANDALKLDGVMDDTFWRRAQQISEFNRRDGDRRPYLGTTAAVVWTTNGICVGISCYDDSAESLKTTVTDRDGPVFQDDSVEVFIATSPSEKSFFHFACSVDGILQDDRNMRNVDWNGKWQVKTKRLPDRWEAEIFIPFETVEMKPAAGHVWRLNITRSVSATGEQSSWTSTDGVPFRTSGFGELVFGDELPSLRFFVTSRDIDRYDSRASGHVFNPTTTTVDAVLRMQVFDSNGLSVTKSKEVTAEPLLETTFDLPFEVQRPGRHTVCLTLLLNDTEICRQTLVDSLAPHKFDHLATVVPVPVVSAGEDVAFRVYVNLPDAGSAAHDVRARLEHDGALVAELVEKARAGSVRFKLPGAALAAGEYQLVVDLLDGDEQAIESSSNTITIIAPTPKVERIRTTAQGMRIGDTSVFPVVIMGNAPVPADRGITAVLPDFPDSIAFLDLPHELMLRALAELNMHMVLPTSLLLDESRRTIATYRNRSAVLAWLVADRPFMTKHNYKKWSGGIGNVAALHGIRDVAGALDPTHPSLVLAGNRRAFRISASMADILAVVDTSGDARKTANLVRAGLAAKGDDGAVWLAQMHAPDYTLIPASFRAGTFAAIIVGASGVIWDAKFLLPEPAEPEPAEPEPTALDPKEPQPGDLEPVQLEPLHPDPVELAPLNPEPVSADVIQSDPIEPIDAAEAAGDPAAEEEPGDQPDPTTDDGAEPEPAVEEAVEEETAPEDKEAVVLRVLRELKHLEPIIAEGSRRDTKRIVRGKFEVHTTRIAHDGSDYILAANVGTAAGQAVFTVPGDLVESMLDDRKYTASGGSLTLDFDPYTVYALRLIEQKPLFTALKIPDAPELDGNLGDKSWRQVPVASGFTRDGGQGQPKVPTEVRLTWTTAALHIGIRCGELDMSTVGATVAETDGPVWDDDSIRIFVDPNHDNETWYELAFNVDGIRFDQLMQQGAESWSGDWQVACHKHAKHWEAEIAIPLDLFGEAPAAGATWGLNIGRHSKAAGQRMEWSCTFGQPYTPNRFGDLVFGSGSPAPFVTVQHATFNLGSNNLVGILTNTGTTSQDVELMYEFVDENGQASTQKSLVLLKERARARFEFEYDVRMNGFQSLNVTLSSANTIFHRECLVHFVGDR